MNAKVLSALCLTIVCTAVVALPTTPDGQPLLSPRYKNPAEMYYGSGLEALEKQDLKVAELAFARSAEQNVRFAAPLLGLAHTAMRRKDVSAAESWLRKALQVAPNSSEVQTSWARFLFSRQRLPEAALALERAISLDARAFSPRIDLAELQLNGLNRSEKAVQSYREALKIQPDHAGAHFGLGMALSALGKIEQAIEALQVAARLSPDNALPEQALARLYALKGDQKTAEHQLEAALLKQPDFVAARIGLGDLYMAQGALEKVREQFQTAIAAAPGVAAVHVKLGMALHGLKRFDAAKKAYHAALQLDSRQAVAYNNLASIGLETKENGKDLLTWSRKAVELAPRVPEFRDTLAWAYRAHGDTESARKMLEEASRMTPERANVFYHLGRMHHEAGDVAAAVQSLKRALRIDKHHAEARQLLDQLARSK
jgi:tetratricopeptide (TPR) repeat protein